MCHVVMRQQLAVYENTIGGRATSAVLLRNAVGMQLQWVEEEGEASVVRQGCVPE